MTATSPSSVTPRCWEPFNKIRLDPGCYNYMTCHWTDVERGIVVPKYRGQIFYFADLREMWVYYPEEIKPPRKQPKWSSVLITVLFVAGCTLLGLLIWELLGRMFLR